MRGTTYRRFRVAAILLLLTPGCVNIDFKDPRLGEKGRVRFTGGGCNDSTTLAIGSKQTLTVEPDQDDGTLPADLKAVSTEPEVIHVADGTKPNEVILTARQEGSSRIELYSGDSLYDWLRFHAEAAAVAEFEAPSLVFAGGTCHVKVTDVFGPCGTTECKLIGEDFLTWTMDPEAAMTFRSDGGRVALFDAREPGKVRIRATDPAKDTVLIDHTVTVVPVHDAGTLDGSISVMLPSEDQLLAPQPAPVSLPVGSLFQIKVWAPDAQGLNVPISTSDATWSLEGDEGVVAPWVEGQPADGPIYEALKPGDATVVAKLDLLGQEASFDITVTE